MEPIQISIAEPCHENWQNMDNRSQGRFCNACAKTVVDFTLMTDNQVLNYLLDKKNDNLCGRFFAGQLDTTLEAAPVQAPGKSWKWNIFFGFLFLLAKADRVHAQTGKPHTEQVKQNPPDPVYRMGAVATRPVVKEYTYKGVVLDEQNKAIPFATVMLIKDRKSAVASNEQGEFQIRVEENDTLFISAAGFLDKAVAIKNKHSETIILKQVNYNLGRILVKPASGIKRSRRGTEEFILEVKDSLTQNVPQDVSFHFTRKDDEQAVPYEVNEKTGVHRLLNVMKDQVYEVKITASGYEAKTVTIAYGGKPNTCEKKTIYLNSDRHLQISKGLFFISPMKASHVNTVPSTSTSAVKLYPNPVHPGNEVSVFMPFEQTGPCRILVSNAAGLLVFQQDRVIKPGQKGFTLPIDHKWAAGVYYLVIDRYGKQTGRVSFVVE